MIFGGHSGQPLCLDVSSLSHGAIYAKLPELCQHLAKYCVFILSDTEARTAQIWTFTDGKEEKNPLINSYHSSRR